MSNQWTLDLALSSDGAANVAEPTLPEVKPVESTPAKRRASLWRWLVPRFSLRTMLLLMTVLCLLLGSGILRAERQRVACRKLTENGWGWSFEQSEDDFNPYRDVLNQKEPWWVRWLSEDVRRSHGVHYWRSVETVYDNDAKAPEMFAAIAQLPALRELIITHGEHPSGRAIWPLVGRLRNLRKLVLRQTTVDDEGLAHMGRLTALTHLNLDDTIVGDQGVKQLSRLTSLENLSLNDTNVTDESIPYLVALPRLKRVDLSNTRVTPQGLQALRRRPSSIEIATGSPVRVRSNSGLGAFGRSNRENLFSESWDAAPPSDSQPTLNELTVEADAPLTPEQVETLSSVLYLKRLTLRGLAIGDADLKHLWQSYAIQEWCLDRTSIGHKGFKWLGKRSTLGDVTVIGSPVTAQDIKSLGAFQNLRALRLRDMSIDKATIRAIFAVPSLRALDLTNCQLPADAAEEFARSKDSPNQPACSFENLIWDGVEVNESVLQWLNGTAAEPYTPAVDKFRPGFQGCLIIGNRRADYDVLVMKSRFVQEPHILKALSARPSCRDFDFTGAHVGSGVMNALASNPYLASLAIAKTEIGDHDLDRAANWTQLAALDLSGCSVTDAGIAQLEPCWRMEHLRLDGTDIGDESIKTIVTMKRLKVLSLRGTKVTDAGLRQLEALKELDVLRLGGTQVTPAAAAEFDRRHSDCRVDLVGPEVYDVPSFHDHY